MQKKLKNVKINSEPEQSQAIMCQRFFDYFCLIFEILVYYSIRQDQYYNYKSMTNNSCFVCENEFPKGSLEMNTEILLPVCAECKGTNNEKKKVEEYLDSLAEGFVCGCI